jgi:glycosyltransferase involved in cell wall biosynthesis
MKVLQIGKYYPPHKGGMETHLQTLCTGLRNQMQIEVLVANDVCATERELVEGVSVSRLATVTTLASTPICPSLVSRISASQSDIVHIHLPNPAAVLAYLASGHRGRLIVTYHSDIIRQKLLGRLHEPFLQILLRRSSAIIATSPNYLNTSRALAPHKNKCLVIPFGIRLSDFDQPDSSAVLQLQKQYGDRLFLSVGRLVYYKGFECLLHAMTKVRGTLLLVGNGPLRAALRNLAKSLGLNGRVIFCTDVAEQSLLSYFHAARFLVLPSIARSEAFGLVQLEAMACGRPVVNTNLDSGVPFVSLDGITGLTVPPADAEHLALAINHLLDNPERCRRLGDAALLRVRTEFTVEQMIERVASLYRTVLAYNPEHQPASCHL